MLQNRKRKFVRWLLVIVSLIVIVSLLIYCLPLMRTRNVKMTAERVTPALIERGAYLANHVAVCMDCHAQRDWTHYSGPPTPGTKGAGGEVFNRAMGFPGVFYSKNITPGNIGAWTDDDILKAFTTGVEPGGEVLFPIMPYPYYRHLDPIDAAAIVAYLRTLPPSKNKTPKRSLDFPMNILVRTIVHAPDFKKMPAKSNKVAYGGYLATMAACAECHTPATHGQIDPQQLFAGGRIFKMPYGDLVSSNITPDSTDGIGRWSSAQFVAKFKFFADTTHLGAVGPKDKNTLMPWSMYGGMDSADLAAIYVYLRSLPARKTLAKM